MGGQAGAIWAERPAEPTSVASLLGELRYGRELARLLSSSVFRSVEQRETAPPVLLVPGFMAGDASLSVLRQWLMRRGHHVHMSGIRANVDCAEELVVRLDEQLQALASEREERVFLIGQSRGGVLARALAVREPDAVGGLAMLGSPVKDGLAVSTHVLRAARVVATLGDLGVPGVLSHSCQDGACCADFRAQLAAPLPQHVQATAMYSYTDAIVDWRACVDPYAQPIAVDSSHCGMSVNVNVYKVLDRALDEGS
ncbi:MAG TPA: alpha/beta hydrolase [Solirubrobacteraceae bacterium]|jgi:triacylglycerol lipase|nr:alpha/beta hydrolase [Solirubrobacteraceae bacterium]